ncbi:MAG: glycosyltransferase [Pyrinomonadaceae bacterium MAG19_C2-C3]|nr:glycosyltransferase [Pyrinomonadaceae bacterium MAG19_C2-C3]
MMQAAAIIDRAATDERIGVMHLTDTLGAGGAERVAVQMVNFLPRELYRSFLCTTRWGGALAEMIASDVEQLHLSRQSRFDWRAVNNLARYVRHHRIQILHAHQTSLFIAVAASLLPPFPKVIWHDHFGRHDYDARPVWIYRQAAKRVGGVIAVNESLADWSRSRLAVPSNRVWYVPNFTTESQAANDDGEIPALPGQTGERIVCVANFRPQKDHLTLVRAMKRVVQEAPGAHLLLVGVEVDENYVEKIRREIAVHELGRNITLLGERRDVAEILKQCDIGVLSSVSEGLPLALIEYGMARLPAVATKVGQCGEVLDYGRAGMLVSHAAPEKLANSLLTLLRSPGRRQRLGEKFYRRVQEFYSPRSAMRKINKVYETVLSGKARRA